jgi:negative modulator of initiation of replication
MKSIPVDDDVYNHVLKSASFIGEDGTSILRRLLGLTRQTPAPAKPRPDEPGLSALGPSPIDDCIASPRVTTNRDVVGRFLGILSWLYQKHRADFEKVLMIEGRKRKYFSKSADELAEAGSSVNPQQIPDSPFWVITNNDTPKKARILADVLQVLGYTWHDVKKVQQALA